MSTDAYRICIIVPAGYPHSHAFLELALLLKSAIQDNGYACDFGLNEIHPQRINVLLGYHLLKEDPALDHARFIPFQLEQLDDSGRTLSPRSERILRKAKKVWDYSKENIAFLARRGIEAYHVPLGYHVRLERIKKDVAKDVDVFFYGSGGERRVAILDALSGDPSINAKSAFGIYGANRDQWISRSRIVLNIHALPAQIFEAVRVSYLLNNGVFVISESSSFYPYDRVPLCMVPYEEIVSTCYHYCRNLSSAEDQAIACYEAFKKHYPMSELISPVLT